MDEMLEDLGECLGAAPNDFQVEGETVYLRDRSCNFYHNNYFSSSDLENVCAKHSAKGMLFFNSNGTVSFVIKK